MKRLILLLACACVPADTRGLVDDDDSGDTDRMDTGDVDTEDADTELPLVDRATLYSPQRVHSPINGWALAAMRQTAIAGTGQADVFMKIGASSTVSARTLHCFSDPVDLGSYADLQATQDHYRQGDAAGTTPFDRDTLAAVSGRTAAWAMTGNPSPVEQEIAAISPSVAVIHYGTNDMGWLSTRPASLDWFSGHLLTLIEYSEGQGILPVVTGISRRGDSEAADRWVDTFNAAIRAIAQEHQVPFVDLELATRHLDGYGLAGDGLHLEGYDGGACVLTDEALDHGYNVRNLVVLQALDRVHRAVNLGQAAPDEGEPLNGSGASDAPWQVPWLPFAHIGNTAQSVHRELDVYTGCEAEQDESGPEYSYTFTLSEPTAVRLTVSDRADADVDIHLLDASGTVEGCIARAHQSLAGTLAPGTYTVVVDSWVDDGDELAGVYIFTIVECLAGDPACADAF